jgi:hypothetical protein
MRTSATLASSSGCSSAAPATDNRPNQIRIAAGELSKNWIERQLERESRLRSKRFERPNLTGG